ncbi:hypothetical protein [Daejeonella sp. H1SJ63]|uniref:hypothetical protein n=1 Tax=Daejeonella sp. H1SJ63 TaxID=3034145 RepID=UPI0023EC6CBD|nr:hypothetical protein [Daejeonella sp. H1SJ63]
MKRLILFLFVLNLIPGKSEAQHSDNNKSLQPLFSMQDSLQRLSFIMINDSIEPQRYNASYTFIKTLVNTLKTPYSFNFPFDSLKTVSIQTAPDKRFRIFSWHVMNNDGSYRYYGTIQMNNAAGKLEMFPLVDYTPAIKNPQDTVTTNDKWFGAQYYKIISVSSNVLTPYYLLLGWKGNTIKSTKKVIEILYFRDGKAYFGMPVFDGDKDNAGKKRIVFEYDRKASMLLNFEPSIGTIVFDHLAPPDPKLKGKYELYGPDFSYDGFKLSNGRWKFVQDLELKNAPTDQDDNFNDPKKMRGN